GRVARAAIGQRAAARGRGRPRRASAGALGSFPRPLDSADVTTAELREIEHQILRRRPEHSINPSLDRIRELTGLLGDPQRSYPVIHITGTNGKSSTARMTQTLLRTRGLRTGLFTSPHLVSMRE